MHEEYCRIARERIAELEHKFKSLSNPPTGTDLEIAALDAYEAGVEAARLARQLGEPVPEWALPAEEQRAANARLLIEQRQKEFFATGNPMCIFSAYLEARSISDPLPEWILDYFDKAISRFWRSFQAYAVARKREDSLSNRPDEEIAAAFGMKLPKFNNKRGKSGRGTVWSRFAEKDWIILGGQIATKLTAWAMNGEPAKETAAIAEVAQRARVSLTTAGRAWRRYKAEYPEAVALARSFIKRP